MSTNDRKDTQLLSMFVDHVPRPHADHATITSDHHHRLLNGHNSFQLRRHFTMSNTMNFAPYQDESPEVERAFSPPNNFRSPRGSPPAVGPPPSSNNFAGEGHIQTSGYGNTGFGPDVEGGRWSLGAFDTSLPIRMDFEAMLAYLLLPPAGGVFLLLFEHKSDYVRYVVGTGYKLLERCHCG